MLNSSAEYALEASLLLARAYPDGPRTSAELARELDLPSNFLSKLLNRLRREGILDSRRGPNGGFRLARAPGDVTLAEVIGPFDDVARGRKCLLGRPECRDDSACAAHGRWKRIAERIESFFRETTLDDVGTPAGAGGSGGRGRPVAAAGLRRMDAMAGGEEPA